MGNTYAPSLQKNSYVTLTRDFTAGHPLLEKMRREMRAKNIHVVNTISGEKGAKRAVADYENGGELIAKPMETRKFRQSQTIMDKKSGKVRDGTYRSPRTSSLVYSWSQTSTSTTQASRDWSVRSQDSRCSMTSTRALWSCSVEHSRT